MFFYDRKKFRYRKNIPAPVPSNVPDELVNAHVSRRITAFMIDIITFFFIIFGLLVVLGAMFNLDSNAIGALLVLGFYPIIILYFAVFDAGLGKLNATPGKKLLSIIVTDNQSQQLSFRSSLKRALLKVIVLTLFVFTYIIALSNSVLLIIPIIFAFLMFPPLSLSDVFSRTLPSLWDRIMKTRVVMDPGKERITES